jgi:hypothetical protein
MAGNRKMIFEPAYHFSRKNATVVLAQAAETQTAKAKREKPTQN